MCVPVLIMSVCVVIIIVVVVVEVVVRVGPVFFVCDLLKCQF